MMHILSVPIVPQASFFKPQLELFWFAHRELYGASAEEKALPVVITRNTPEQAEEPLLGWGLGPCIAAKPYFEQLKISHSQVKLSLNIQCGLQALISRLEDDIVIEVLDVDMYHFRAAPKLAVSKGALYVSTVYEDWHLKSLSEHKHVIAPYFEHGGSGYNGGFVPIIGHVATFKAVLREWISVHVDILNRGFGSSTPDIHWWAGMYALQAACEKARIKMVNYDGCLIRPANMLSSSMYISHYSVDPLLSKTTMFKQADIMSMPDEPDYNVFKRWAAQRTRGAA